MPGASPRLLLEARTASPDGRLLEFGGEADHVHMLVSLPPALWSPSYSVDSCGGAPLETIKEYVRSQARSE